jgi:very-short-patch-repair endonuclease/restriction endonuclease S subunit
MNCEISEAKSNYRKIGDFIELVDERNRDLSITLLLGLTVNKIFIPSVANTIGTDMANYKIIRKGQFACSIMQVRRDKKMPVALLKDFDEAIISQAYPVFEIKDETELLPEYLMMWFSRSEFDREACFYAVGGVRGSLEWDDFLNMELPIPSIEKQRAIVKEYNTVVNRIKLNEELNQKLEETAQALYKHWFVDFEFPYSPPKEGCPQDGVVDKTDPQDGMVDMARPQNGVVIKRNTKNYKSLPYNPKLKERAKALRKAGNLAEVLFWKQVHKGKFKGLDFDRQKIIGNYIVDFYCANVNVVVEIDGSSHDNKQDYDAARDTYLEGLGLTVIHITDTDVKKNLDRTMMWLSNHPAFQAPLQRRGSLGYKSSGGKMVWNEELEKDIPEDWEVKTLDNYCECLDNLRKPLSGDERDKIKGDYPYFGAMSIVDYINQFIYNGVYLLVSEDGANVVDEAGRPATQYVWGKFWLNNHAHIIKGVNDFSTEYLKVALYFVNAAHLVTGAAQPKINQKNLMSIQLIEPDKKPLTEFNKKIKPSFDLIINISKEIKLLEDLKDLLLSKMTKVEEKEVVL